MNESRPSHEQHRQAGPASLAVSLITISDSRGPREDASGDLIEELLLGAGHRLPGRRLVPDDPGEIRKAVLTALPGSDVILLTGGTGISPRDRTTELIAALCGRMLPGFGELFRMLSYREIGAAAMLSRACAGVREGRLLVALPGATGAVHLALEMLLLPEMGHIVGELRKREGPRA